MSRSTRRRFSATAAGFAIGIFATSRNGVGAQEATPESAVRPLGYVSTRVRSVASADQRTRVNELARDEFAPDVERLDGFQGYALADVIDRPEDSLSILVLEEAEQTAAFLDLAEAFVSGISEEVQTVNTVGWDGDLLIRGIPSENGTPAATPARTGASGYVAMRIYKTIPGIDPRDAVPMTVSDFVPLITDLPGFRGFLWYPTDEEICAISVYDSQESALASTDAACEWVAEFATQYTHDDPEVINANFTYFNMPVFE